MPQLTVGYSPEFFDIHATHTPRDVATFWTTTVETNKTAGAPAMCARAFTSAASAPGPGSPHKYLLRGLIPSLPHLRRDSAHRCHVCTGTAVKASLSHVSGLVRISHAACSSQELTQPGRGGACAGVPSRSSQPHAGARLCVATSQRCNGPAPCGRAGTCRRVSPVPAQIRQGRTRSRRRQMWQVWAQSRRRCGRDAQVRGVVRLQRHRIGPRRRRARAHAVPPRRLMGALVRSALPT